MASPKLFITGAVGQLGRLVIATLLETVPAGDIVAGIRDTGSNAAAALQERGVSVRMADYTQPATLEIAFTGLDRLLLISSTENGKGRFSTGTSLRRPRAPASA